MAFVVEDGTGLPNANAYTDTTFANSYFADKGLSAAWTGTDDVKKFALVRATEYMDLRWGSSLGGVILVTTQSLLMPRSDLYDSQTGQLAEGIPVKWKKSCCEYALISLTSPLMPNPSSPSNNGQVLRASKTKIGPLEFEYDYTGNSGSDLVKSYPIPDLMVQCYLTLGSVNNNRVIR